MRIALAAIKYDNYIYVGLRHSWIRDDIYELLGDSIRLDFIRNSIQGFVDDKGNFLDREQARVIAFDCGQVTKLIGCELTSEDLW
jgi:hypothetical protein